MYYIIYQTTNLINNKRYIGYHSTDNLDDGYLGSGKILKQSIEKNGVDNFKREILYVFPSKHEALQKEKELVNEDFVQREDTYNMKVGGEGGWDHTYNDPEISKRRKEGVTLAFAEGRSTGWKLSKEQRSEIGRSAFKGKTHTKEARKRISEAQLLEESTLNARLEDYNKIEKSWGWKSKLAKKWNVSHTQVNRFIKRYI